MKVYSVDVRIAATAYIKAATADEALAKAKELKLTSPDILDSGGEVPISGLDYDDSELPDVSLSPAMTIHGPHEGTVPEEVADI